MKKILNIFVILLLSLCFIGCGGSKPSDPSGSETPETPTEDVYYTVSFKTNDGDEINETKVKEGQTVSKPVDPSKKDSLFFGWYLDSECETKAEFPLSVNKDMTVYALFVGYDEAFNLARENTIGEEVKGYEYNYTLTANASYSKLSLSGQTQGTTKYNSESVLKFFDKRVNSGNLFFDGVEYQLLEGTTLQSISLNEENKVKKFKNEYVENNYKFDTSSFAKALFEYDEEKLGSIEKTNKPNEYKLNTAFNMTSAISLICNNLNNPILENLLGVLPETSAETGMYVTFQNGEVKTYRYEFSVTSLNITFSLVYELEFVNVGKKPEINKPDFTNLSLSSDEVRKSMTEINNIVNEYKNQESSTYDYVFKTGLDHGLTSLEINSTFAGSASRENKDGTVFFNNEIEIDSDYKNGDLYKDNGLEDIKIQKQMDDSKEVYIIEKKFLKDQKHLQENYIANDFDSYYLLTILKSTNEFNFVQKEQKETEVVYNMGLSEKGIVEILQWINNNMKLDPLAKANVDIALFGNFDENSLEDLELEFNIIVLNGKLSKIEFELSGSMNTSLVSSRDFSENKKAAFDIDLEIDVK